VLRSAVLAGSLLWVGVAAQALTPIAQDRHVFGQREDGFGNIQDVFGFPGTETYSASTYASFSKVTDGYAFPPQFGEGAIVAAQDSTIAAEQLDASGSTTSWPYSGDGERIIGESVYSVTFEVESPGVYALTGQLELDSEFCEGTTEGRIRLSGEGGVLAELSHDLEGWMSGSEEFSAPLATTLLLPVGTYTLEARSKTNGLGASTPVGYLCVGRLTSAYEVHLGPAAPAVPAVPGALVPLLALALALEARPSRAMT
jgi:hypothetical protein